MQTRRLGPFTVSAIGLGCMPMSTRRPTPDADRAIATIHAALDAGVTLLDTADIYAPSWDTMGHNERLVGAALSSWTGDRSSIVVATKGGITRSAEVPWGRDGSPEYLRRALEASLSALGTDRIDLYQWHRPDRHRLFSEVVETFARFREEGLIRAVGLSNVNVEEIEVALEVLGDEGLASVQNEFSPVFTASHDELAFCGAHDIAFLPWSPLGGIGAGATDPRYTPFAEVAAAHGVSPQRVVLAWELSLDDRVIPIPGASRPETIIDSLGAAMLELTPEQVVMLSQSLHVV